MIVKHSTKADECADFAAFIASADFERLPERTRRNALARRRGLEGERATAHILDRHFHDRPDHVLLHDLRLPDGIGGFAQFDHIILSRLSRTATVVEVKNYRGRLSKNEHDEWLAHLVLAAASIAPTCAAEQEVADEFSYVIADFAQQLGILHQRELRRRSRLSAVKS